MISAQDISGLLQRVLRFAGHEETGQGRIVPLIRLGVNLEAEAVIVAARGDVGDDGA